MNKNLGSPIDVSHVKVGDRLYVKTFSLGAALIEVLEDRGVHGWRCQIVQGFLQSPVSKDKRWVHGQIVTLPASSVEKWYQPAEI